MKAGETIYYISYRRCEGYGKELKECEITKVGSIYFSVDIKPYAKIKKETMIDGNDSDNHNRYFLTEQAYNEYIETNELQKVVKQHLNNFSKLPLHKMRKIVQIINE